MEGFNLREELDGIHRTLVELIRDALDSEDPDVRREARREALQLLKQNNISAAAMPDTSASEMARMAGKLRNFTAISEKLTVRATLPASRDQIVPPRLKSQGDPIEVAATLIEPES